MANSNCESAQTFCNINGQLVKDNPNIKFNFSKIIGQSKTKATTEWKQEVINALKAIHNYGSHGTRNPSNNEIESLDLIQQKNKILAEDYNEIIKILSNDTNKQISSKTRLLGTYFDDLESCINNYKLNSDRCNDCNTGCNTTCQSSAQGGCDDSPCNSNCMSYIEGGPGGACDIGCLGTCNLGCQVSGQ